MSAASKREDVEQLCRAAAEHRDAAHRAMAAGDMQAGADALAAAERCDRVAHRIDMHIEAAKHRARAANHRAFGHLEQAESSERQARLCDAAAAEG